VAETAKDAMNTIIAIKSLFAADDAKVAKLGRAAKSAALVFACFKQKPLLSIAEITKRTGLTKPTATGAVARLAKLGIVKKASEKKWGQIFAYSAYATVFI